jgi:carbamoyl-phosphate synthase small subunit
MSGLETSTVVLSAVALLVTLALAVAWRRSRRDLRELRRTVDELSERRTDGGPGIVVVPERTGAGDPYAEPIGAGDPHAKTPTPAVLVLEDGRSFRGEAYGAIGETVGEAVFATGMTGYQETLTDPSYRRQVVVMTAPHIGNTGVNDDDPESRRIWVAGYVVRDPAGRPSNWRARRSLDDELTNQGVVGISGIDTRALTRHLRERGAMRVGISSLSTDVGALLETVRAAPEMAGADLADEVTTTEPYLVRADGVRRGTVAAIDLGIKAMTPRLLSARGLDVHVLPSTATIGDVEATGSDGVFFSNGPGDPATADGPVALLREVLRREIPYFGICFGNQLFGRALGLSTYKLRYGHRGINQPVVDRTTGRVEVTAHNHGFAVDAPIEAPIETEFGPAEVTHVCLNDDVIEGLRLLERPAFSVQYHPEAAAGPHDAAYLFDRFAEMLSDAIRPPGRTAADNSTGEEG